VQFGQVLAAARGAAYGSVGTLVSNTGEPSRLLTIQVTVGIAEVSKAASNVMAGRPLLRDGRSPPFGRMSDADVAREPPCPITLALNLPALRRRLVDAFSRLAPAT
jgi:hypothetical protein